MAKDCNNDPLSVLPRIPHTRPELSCGLYNEGIQKTIARFSRSGVQSFIDIPNIDQLCLNENSTPYLPLRFRSCSHWRRKICTAMASCGKSPSKPPVECDSAPERCTAQSRRCSKRNVSKKSTCVRM